MAVTIDGTSGITFPNSTVQASAGQVLQVVNATGGGSTSTSSTSYIDTTLSATITPKFATSKILVMVNHGVSGADSATSAGVSWNLLRGSTSIFSDNGFYAHPTITYMYAQGWTTSYLDSPATTSATTYKTQIKSAGGSGITIDQAGSTAKITLMEISA